MVPRAARASGPAPARSSRARDSSVTSWSRPPGRPSVRRRRSGRPAAGRGCPGRRPSARRSRDLGQRRLVDLRPLQAQLLERVRRADPARDMKAELHPEGGRRVEQPRAAAPAAARRAPGPWTPKTARTITSSVTACIRSTANASPARPRRRRRARPRRAPSPRGAHPLAVERRQHQLSPREVLTGPRAAAGSTARPPAAAPRRGRAAVRERRSVWRADRGPVQEHGRRRSGTEEADAEGPRRRRRQDSRKVIGRSSQRAVWSRRLGRARREHVATLGPGGPCCAALSAAVPPWSSAASARRQSGTTGTSRRRSGSVPEADHVAVLVQERPTRGRINPGRQPVVHA